MGIISGLLLDHLPQVKKKIKEISFHFQFKLFFNHYKSILTLSREGFNLLFSSHQNKNVGYLNNFNLTILVKPRLRKKHS